MSKVVECFEKITVTLFVFPDCRRSPGGAISVAEQQAESVRSPSRSKEDGKRRYEKPRIAWEDDLVSKVGLTNGCAKVSEHPLCGAASTS